ncbi:carbohydrate ABC transporter substrate-binding protein, CUT1 family [Alteribacillus persepolensis]|uniref:Carbohydrate ABC transporter substrate-binding protein, CUT1 family n=1 Tax=Alteribacillus persepolensis TaxID=568899 RepID=A0A1G8GKU9_9BACI|nr:extracellular solute-binding protein [Alteribacillus persepolensis]SDH94920.1 carbohydrate ABC transporter substrate-binding protein, CUT1 family [Alteribacillus persepolensis]
MLRHVLKKASVVSAIIGGVLISGCSGGDGAEETTSEEASQSISVAMPAGAESSALKPLISEFEEETGTTVEWNEFDYNTLYERILNDLQSQAGTYDVIFADDPWMPMFAGGGYLTPLDQLGYEADNDFIDNMKTITHWPAPEGPRMPGFEEEEPRQYGIPQVGNVQLLFWRKDIMGDAPPETWDEALAAIDEYSGETKYGFVPRGARGNPVTTNFNAFLWSHGGDYFDNDWNVIVNNDNAQEAMDTYVKLAESAPSGVANYGADEVGRAMAAGDALMAVIWPVWAETMENEEESEVAGNIGYGLVPKSKQGDYAPQIGNWIFAIPQASQNKQTAMTFIEWASSEDIQTEMTKNGGLPTRESVLTNEQLIEDMPYLEAVHEGLENAQFRPRTPSYTQIEELTGTYLNEVLSGSRSGEEALNEAANEIEALMKSEGYYD